MENQSFVFPVAQRFACQDCTSRCCKNWTVDVSQSDVKRFESEEWIRSRLKETSSHFRRLGADHYLLPTVEKDRQLQCAFLEEDGLCGMHKRYGHDFLAASCKTFPFDFIADENQKILVITSKVCPSIRENYGELVGEIIRRKFEQSGGKARQQAPFLTIGEGIPLSLHQYSFLFGKWETLISTEPILPLGLVFCHKLLELLAERWKGQKEVNEADFENGLKEALEELEFSRDDLLAELRSESLGTHRLTDVFLALTCLPLTYPLRSRVLFLGLAKAKFLAGVLASALSLFTYQGTIDAIYLGAAIPLNPRIRDRKALDEEQIANIRAYLLQVLTRRKFAMQPRSLNEILFVLMTVPAAYGLFAKLSAAGKGRENPNCEDFRESISALEMSILHQNGFLSSSKLFQVFLPFIFSNPKTLFSLLTKEIELSNSTGK